MPLCRALPTTLFETELLFYNLNPRKDGSVAHRNPLVCIPQVLLELLGQMSLPMDLPLKLFYVFVPYYLCLHMCEEVLSYQWGHQIPWIWSYRLF